VTKYALGMAKLYERRRDGGDCWRCGRPLGESKTKTCRDCLDRFRVYRIVRKDKPSEA
jgi:hypothetical protein